MTNIIDYFVGIAYVVSQSSNDGCVIIDRRNRVIGIGSLGENIIANCIIHPKTIEGGVTAFMIRLPSLYDCQTLLENHVEHWIIAERKGWTEPRPEEEEAFRKLELDLKVDIRWVKPNLNWLFQSDLINELKELGFVS